MTQDAQTRIRADELALRLGLAESRSQARERIRAGVLLLPDGQPVDKPARSLAPDTALRLAEGAACYVSRAAGKLLAFLEAFPACDPAGQYALDAGASTGGFTQVLLERGAAQVVCVDVGHGQLHPSLAADPRVVNMEGVNARSLQAADLPRPRFGVLVMDLSFISLRKVLPNLWPLLEPGGWLVALVKPQFEAGSATEDTPATASSHVIHDPGERLRLAESVAAFALEELPEAEKIGLIESPVVGHAGNVEYLLGLRHR